MKVGKAKNYDILIIGDKDAPSALKAAAEKSKGTALFLDRQADASLVEPALEEIGATEQKGSFAIVGEKDSPVVQACQISIVGDSVVVHCPDVLIPIEEPPSHKAKKPAA